jgi:VanZ family protein
VIPEELAAYPGFLPGVAVALAAAVVLSGWAGRRLGTGRVRAALLLASVGLVLAATLTPGREALDGALVSTGRGCDLSRLGPAPLAVYLVPGEASGNVLLFLPLGLAVGVLPRSSRSGLVWLAAVALPLAIEVAQLVLAPLGRACQVADVFDNLIGFGIGLSIGLAIGLSVEVAEAVRARTGRADERPLGTGRPAPPD